MKYQRSLHLVFKFRDDFAAHLQTHDVSKFSGMFWTLLSLNFWISSERMPQILTFCFRLTFGTLYPAYRSYKAVKTKDVREYVSWKWDFLAIVEACYVLPRWIMLIQALVASKGNANLCLYIGLLFAINQQFSFQSYIYSISLFCNYFIT